MAKIKTEKANKDGWSDWIKPIDGKFRMFCCDCSLGHDMEFEIDEDGCVIFRAKRNNKSTGQMRRHRNIKVRHTYEG